MALEKKPLVTFVGRLIYAKGVQHLIKACEGLDVDIVIIGDGPYKEQLEQLCRDSRCNCFFPGFLGLKEVIDWLKGSAIFVNPSYAEGLPTSVLEAGVVGLPVIATDVGGTSEIITHSYNGLLVKPKNEIDLRFFIEKLLEDEELAQLFGQRLRETIKKNFDWNKNIKKIEDLIK